MSFETAKCVVLNSTYEPITMVSSKRAIILIMEGKAIVLEEHPSLVVRSASHTLKVPIAVILKHYVKSRKIFTRSAGLTQKNLFMRDDYTCQYCLTASNKLKSKEFLTKDHVIPVCKGGKSTWENLVTACSTCNNKKGNKDLDNTDLILHKKPYAPSVFHMWMKSNNNIFNINLEDFILNISQ
jgi:5-methylcytosine-specific restriction endonuclease McrA